MRGLSDLSMGLANSPVGAFHRIALHQFPVAFGLNFVQFYAVTT
jgi:hypothetical protein